MRMLKKLNTFVYSAALSVASLWALPLFADDTDIYINSATSADEPMIMFTIDWRPNLTANVCNGFTIGGSDATIAAECSGNTGNTWTEALVSNLSAADKADGVINRFEMMRAVLKNVMTPLDGVKIGVMITHNDTCNGQGASGPTQNNCSNGAYILQGFKSINAGDTNGNKAAFHAKLAGIPEVVSPGHQFQGAEMYFELFRYLTGQGVYNGHLGWDSLGLPGGYNLNEAPNPALDKNGDPNPDYRAIAWDATIEDNKAGTDTYITPFREGATCSRVFAINILFGVTSQDGDSTNAIKQSYAGGGMNGLTLPSNSEFDTAIQWMYNNDLADGKISMRYDKDGDLVNTTNDRTNLMLDLDGKNNVTSYFFVKSPSTTENTWARLGGTNSAYSMSDDPEEMAKSISSIFNQILSVSTTFVSASVPVNVFNRAEFLDDVYIAVFEAEENGYPKWIGNLKKLKLTQDASAQWFIGDANKNPAFSADGRINFNALTFWTDAKGDDVVAADTDDGEISGFDGRSVNRGGAAQKIPGMLRYSGASQNGQPGLSNGSGNRYVYTEPDTYPYPNTAVTATTLKPLNATSSIASDLWSDLNDDGVASSASTTNVKILNNTAWSAATDYSTASAAEQTEALDLLKFARGIDVADEDGDGDTTEPREWIMGDPIHSRPLTINYGDSDGTGGYDADNPDVRIIVTSNTGAVHMIENTTAAGVESGKENWAFYPRYALRIQKRLKDNIAGSPSTTSQPVHPYGIDGAPTVFTKDVNYDGNLRVADGDKVYVYFGMRRGGQGYYALDISDPNSPKMLWSIDNNTAGFSELGLTFSRPILTRMSYDTNLNQPVLVFGAGYDVNKDIRSDALGTDDAMGRGIYIVHAETGALIWKSVYGSTDLMISASEYQLSSLKDSIPSDVAVLDSDGDGSTDRIYAVSTGGDIFRFNMPSTDRTKWKGWLFAKTGRNVSGQTKDGDRRYFHSVDVVQTIGLSGYFDAVIVGSGDRANPLDKGIDPTLVPQNWFYMFKDKNVQKTEPSPIPTPVLTTDLADLSDNCMQYSTLVEGCSAATKTALNDYGWRIKLDQTAGEKALSRPITLAGIIFFTTYLPPDTTTTAYCGPVEGSGSTYAVNLQDATPAFDWDLTNTFIDSVGDTQTMAASDRYRQAGAGIPADVIAIRKGGLLQAVTPGDNYTTTVSQNAGWKTFWYTEGD